MKSTELRLEGRNGAIWRRYCSGATQQQLADEYGIAQTTVSGIIAKVRAEIPQETKEEKRAALADLYDEMSDALAEIARGGPIPAYSQGRKIVLREADPDNGVEEVVASDYSGVAKAIDSLVKLTESKRKMLGLDAPIENTVTSKVTYEVVGIDMGDLR